VRAVIDKASWRARPRAELPEAVTRDRPVVADCWYPRAAALWQADLDQGNSRSLNLDHRRSSRLPLTAIASARFWPTRTTNRLPRVMPV